MKKVALIALLLASTSPAHADKLDDSFPEIQGTWCYLRQDGATTTYARTDPTTKKRCSKTGKVEWITIDNVATFSGSEYSCLAKEGGDFRKVGRHMMFKFDYRCSGEGYKWRKVVSFLIDADGNLRVGIDKK
jgi:hypothetical protein